MLTEAELDSIELLLNTTGPWPDDMRRLLAEVKRYREMIWPGLPKFEPTTEHPQQDFFEAVCDSFRTQHERDQGLPKVLARACRETLAAVDEAYKATGYIKVAETSDQRQAIVAAIKHTEELA